MLYTSVKHLETSLVNYKVVCTAPRIFWLAEDSLRFLIIYISLGVSIKRRFSRFSVLIVTIILYTRLTAGAIYLALTVSTGAP